MARFAGRMCSATGHHRYTNGFHQQQNIQKNKVYSNQEWRTIMDTDPTSIAPVMCLIRFIYKTILQIVFDVYLFFIKKWDWTMTERLELITWLEEVTGRKYKDMEEVWINGGKTISLLIQRKIKDVPLSITSNSMYSAQNLAVTQLGLAKVFTKKELVQEKFNLVLEKKLITFLINVKNSLTLIEKYESTGYRISENIIARGVGLYAAYAGRRAIFNIYSKTDSCLEGVIIEMKGQGESAVLIIGGEHFDGDIRLEYKKKKGKILVSYIVSDIGQYCLKISQNGFHVPGSPFEVHVEKAPDGYTGQFGSAEWYKPEIKEIPKISGIVDLNGEKVKLNRNVGELKSVFLNKLPEPESDVSPKKKALSLLSPEVSPQTKRQENILMDEKRIVKLSDVASTLIYVRKFTTKLKTPFEIKLENFHYFDNINALSSKSRSHADLIENEIVNSLSHDKFILRPPSSKLQSPNWIVDRVDKKEDGKSVEGGEQEFNVWPSMTAFGPPHKSNRPPSPSNLISCNNLNTVTMPSLTNGKDTNTTTYISPDGSAFPISFNQNKISCDNPFKTTLENNETSVIYFKNKFKDSAIHSTADSILINSSAYKNYQVDTKSPNISNCTVNNLFESPLNNADSNLSVRSSSLQDRFEGSDKMESYSSEESYRMPSKERIIEVALKAEYEYTVFVPKDKREQNSLELIKSNNNKKNNCLKSIFSSKTGPSIGNNKAATEKMNVEKCTRKTKRRCASVISIIDLKKNSLREKYDLRRTQSAFSKFSCKPLTSAISYIKNRKQVFIRIGEYAKGSTEVIKSSKSVKKWKNYWDSFQCERNVYSLEGNNCSLELQGIVAKGKYLFENMSQKDKPHRTVPIRVQEENNRVETDSDYSVKSEEDPERKKRFHNARSIFASLENSSKRKYRSLPTKFKQIKPGERRKRINSECFESSRSFSERFHVIDLYRDLQEGLGAPGIPHRLAVLASLKSVESRETVDLPGYSVQYPHIPTTPQNKYTHRSNIDKLIPWVQIVKVS